MTGQFALVHQGPGLGRPETVEPQAPLPLVLDLDRALPDGLAWELALRARPARFPGLAWAALGGGDALERAACAALDSARPLPATFPLEAAFRDALARAADEGRDIVLVTRSRRALAEALQNTYPGIVGVVAAPAGEPIADLARTAAIRRRCPGGFVVLPEESEPWARGAASYGSAEKADDATRPPAPLRVWRKALRLHQWVKNLLVFVPPVLAGAVADPLAWFLAACAFLAFGLAASATYLLNDLHDLNHDRAHRSKRYRPLASGALPIPHALTAAGVGLAGAGVLACAGGTLGLAVVSAYLVLTLAYTLAIKRTMIADTVTLAGLFTLRLVAGIVFCDVAGSAWLLAFSMVVFTALALAKRFIEIEALKATGGVRVAGRGYTAQDGPAVLALGAGASASAVLILALYIVEAPTHNPFYAQPEWLWAAPAALFVWLGRIWILCGRGALRDDPVEFALTDRPSLALCLLIAASFALACCPI